MKKCGEAYVRLGRPAGILTADKRFSILIAPSPDIAKHAGQMKNGKIHATDFEVQQGNDWQAVRLSAIM